VEARPHSNKATARIADVHRHRGCSTHCISRKGSHARCVVLLLPVVQVAYRHVRVADGFDLAQAVLESQRVKLAVQSVEPAAAL
jgi:hypothetical protein